jgi:ATP-binding cassette, subfamily B, bacterial
MSAPPPSDADAPAPPTTTLRETIVMLGELHGSLARPTVRLVVVGALAGLAEAVALLAFVRAAVTITSDDIDVSGLAGAELGLSPGSLLVVALGLATVAALLHVLLARGSATLTMRVGNNARARLIDGFLGAQWAYVAGHREGRFQEAMSRLTEGASRAAAHLAMGLSSLVILAVLGVAAILASPAVSLALLALPVFAVLVVGPFVRRLRTRARLDMDSSLGLAETTAVTVRMARDYRTFGVQEERAAELRSVSEQHGARASRTRMAGFTLNFLFKDIALIALIVVVGGLYLVTDLREGSVVAAVLLVIRMLGYLQQAVRLLHEGAGDAAAITALDEAIREFESMAEPDGSTVLHELGPIELRAVHYAYDDLSGGGVTRIALAGIDLTIEPNTTVGIVGPSGAGKTTIAELLLGLRRPTSGSITVGGTDLGDVRRDAWTRLTAFVPQDQQLAAVSVADNIAFLRGWVDHEDVVEGARRAHVHDEITALPDGYGYVIGSRSQGLSGGQRQRIAIARALAGHPRMLVLDEPTSALDAVTEQLFRQTLEELHGHVTMVIIAHRPATLEVCDTVVHMAEGLIVDITTGQRHDSAAADWVSSEALWPTD